MSLQAGEMALPDDRVSAANKVKIRNWKSKREKTEASIVPILARVAPAVVTLMTQGDCKES